MYDFEIALELEAQVTKTSEISDAELDQVTGGIVCRKAGEHPLEY
jgi:bacteriocin-like protein